MFCSEVVVFVLDEAGCEIINIMAALAVTKYRWIPSQRMSVLVTTEKARNVCKAFPRAAAMPEPESAGSELRRLRVSIGVRSETSGSTNDQTRKRLLHTTVGIQASACLPTLWLDLAKTIDLHPGVDPPLDFTSLDYLVLYGSDEGKLKEWQRRKRLFGCGTRDFAHVPERNLRDFCITMSRS